MSDEKTRLNLQLTWTDPRSGETIEQVFDLPITIGRDSKNTIMVPSTSVSRQHVSIEFQEEKVHVKDLGSSNGTYVNGELIEGGHLSDGDEMTLGEIAFKVVFTKQARTKRPTRDHLFGALLEGEGEPTITLKSIKGKNALFADLSPDSANKIESPRPTAEVEAQRLSGDALKEFLGKSLQKDMATDIAPDVEVIADNFRAKPPAEAPSPASQPEKSSQAEENAMSKVWTRLRRWFGN